MFPKRPASAVTCRDEGDVGQRGGARALRWRPALCLCGKGRRSPLAGMAVTLGRWTTHPRPRGAACAGTGPAVAAQRRAAPWSERYRPPRGPAACCAGRSPVAPSSSAGSSTTTAAGARRRLGSSHTSTIGVTERLAACAHAQGESDRARTLFEGALELRSERFGDNAPDTLLAACNLGSCLKQLGEYRAAFRLNKGTAERCGQRLGKDHATTIATTENLAASPFGRGWHRTALALYQDSHQRR
ncbi:tetratricopeptide repeat protein [Streptomyces sp. NBC_01725]|uniref:tetratricopeptide repeat protein n=1 Tax=Streptomyces sp. NBC_01725 TaxID=2975923 RepID=UPI002E2BF8FE|nr:tetratricopeptide repeat protein [Streptomyces sp. NBC_01725]